MSDLDDLRAGKLVWSSGKLYGVCQQCGQIIRVNKPFIGSLHLCSPEPEKPVKSGARPSAGDPQ